MAACIFAYDWIITLPRFVTTSFRSFSDPHILLNSEYRLYRRQKSLIRPSVACVLFVAARCVPIRVRCGTCYSLWQRSYLGAAYIISTSVLFFSRNFTDASCRSIVPLCAPAFPLVVVQTTDDNYPHLVVAFSVVVSPRPPPSSSSGAPGPFGNVTEWVHFIFLSHGISLTPPSRCRQSSSS